MEEYGRFRFDPKGARFLVYPAPKVVRGFRMPRAVRVGARPGAIVPGPTSRRLYVIDALNKQPYRDPATGDYLWRPPYPKAKPARAPVPPDALGHFDHVRPGTPAFSSAMLYAAVRSVIEIWEHYLGRRLSFVAPNGFRRLELIPRVTRIGDNAWSGDGYVEFGFAGKLRSQPYCENFDVVAHEVGHHILKRVIGKAPADRYQFEHKSHEEASADLVSLVAVLHLGPVVAGVLEETRGKLYSRNLLSRIGEYRFRRRGRLAARPAFHDKTLRHVARARKAGDKHTYGQPFLGAAFDILVEIYESRLARRGLISRELALHSTRASARADPSLRRRFAARYRLNPDGFADALRDATADFAAILALAWRKTRRTGATFSRVAANMVAADRRLFRGLYGRIIRRAFRARRIVPRARRP